MRPRRLAHPRSSAAPDLIREPRNTGSRPGPVASFDGHDIRIERLLARLKLNRRLGELFGHGGDQRLPLGLRRVDPGVDRYGLYLGGVDAREDIFYDLVRRFTGAHDAIVEQADDIV